MDHNAEHSIVECLGHVQDVLLGAQGETAWMSQLAVHDWLEHADAKINGEDTTSWVLKGSLTHWATVSEEEAVVLLGEDHGVWTLQVAAIEVLDHWCDFNAIFCNSLAENSLMSLVSDEGGSLHVEDKTGWLTSCGEVDVKRAFWGHEVDISIGGDAEEVTL